MEKMGKVLFFTGALIAIIIGVIVSYDPGFVCNLDAESLPESFWTYPALCFFFWAYGVPVGLIIAATGILMQKKSDLKTALIFGLAALGIYTFISFANGPMPHVPMLFGIGGTLMLVFYFSILWINAKKLRNNVHKLAGYTSLLIGFWFTCGLGSRQYQPILGNGESPIDIMTYFVLAMLFFWLSERKEREKEQIS